MTRRFFVSDLDGTLLDPSGRLSDFTRDTLARLIEDGLVFSVASARSVHSMRDILKDLPLRLPVIEFNGGCVTELGDGRHIYSRPLDPELALGVFERMRARGLRPFISGYNEERDFLAQSGDCNPGMDWYIEERRRISDPRLLELLAHEEALQHPVLSLTAIDTEENIRAIHGELTEMYGEAVHMDLFENRYSRGWYWVSVHDRRANKGDALRFLAEHAGLSDCPLTVFGDQLNDVAMFERADHGVAVANAHEKILGMADETIGTHDEDAVARYLLAMHTETKRAEKTG